jgi:hypothetical protein
MLAAATAALAGGGCGGSPPVSPPFTAELLSYVGGGRYQLADEPLATLRSLDPFTGGAGEIRGGGAISLTGDLGRTDEEIRRALTPDDVHGLDLRYDLDGGVMRSIDYDTFAVFTIYRELERTREFYAGLGVPESALGPMPAYFRGRIEVFFLPLLASNNAAYVPAIDSFMLFNDLFAGNEVPLALNLGVIAHEYGHAVFQHLVWGSRLPPALIENWPFAAVNQLRSLDEGIADLMGATFTDDATFVGRSLAEAADDRDLGAPGRASASQVAAAASEEPDSYDPYPLGTAIARSFWAAGATIGRTEVAGYLVRAEQAMAGQVNSSFLIVQFLEVIARLANSATPAHRLAFCSAFASRLSPLGTATCCANEAAC